MSQQFVGLCLIVLFAGLGALTYPYVRRICQPRTQAE